jgi:N-acetylneuraminate synthase
MNPKELCELIEGSKVIHQSLGGEKDILSEEQPTIDFAYACVVAIQDISAGDIFSEKNIWVKRPGTGEIKAESFESLLGRIAKKDIRINSQIKNEWVSE